MRKYTIWIIGIICLQLIGCKSIKYVPVPEYHYSSTVQTDTFLQKDSIFYHDSVYVEIKGDTITTVKTKIIYKDRWRDRIVRDSIIKVDSIRVPYPVEKELTKWQTMKMKLGNIFICVVSIGSLLLVIGLLMKLRR